MYALTVAAGPAGRAWLAGLPGLAGVLWLLGLLGLLVPPGSVALPGLFDLPGLGALPRLPALAGLVPPDGNALPACPESEAAPPRSTNKVAPVMASMTTRAAAAMTGDRRR